MFSPAVFKLLGIAINFAYYLNALPFHWNFKRQQIICTKSRFKFFCCLFAYLAQILLVLVAIERVILLLRRHDHDEQDPMLVFLFLTAIVCWCMPIAMGGNLLLKLEDAVASFNKTVRYFRLVKDTYTISKESAKGAKQAIPKNERHLIRILVSLLAVEYVYALVVQGYVYYLVFQPERQFVYVSLLPFMEPTETLIIGIGLFQLVITYTALAIVIPLFCMATFFIYGALAVLDEMSHTSREDDLITNSNLRKHPNSLFSYRCLQLITISNNDIWSTSFAICFALAFVLSILTNMCILLYLKTLGLGLIPILIVAFMSAFAQSAMYYRAGLIELISHEWIESWEHHKYIGMEPLDRERLHRYLNSCWPLSTRIGEYTHLSTHSSLHIIGKILFYTAKIMLGLKHPH